MPSRCLFEGSAALFFLLSLDMHFVVSNQWLTQRHLVIGPATNAGGGKTAVPQMATRGQLQKKKRVNLI